MIEKKTISRRKMLGGVGKLAYVAPTLTLLSLSTKNAHALSPPPPPGSQPTGEDMRKKAPNRKRSE
jgi:hypothetical protein